MGAGASECTLTNCVIVANSAIALEGGTDAGSMFNCIIYYNSAPDMPNWGGGGMFIYCCTFPLPEYYGFGGITNEPLFVDLAGGDFRLQTNSPCINAGGNSYASPETDLDGNPRIAGGTVDIGAYQIQNPTSLISYDWLQQYGLPVDGSADFIDMDNDQMNNWQEWQAGTTPTNASLFCACPA